MNVRDIRQIVRHALESAWCNDDPDISLSVGHAETVLDHLHHLENLLDAHASLHDAYTAARMAGVLATARRADRGDSELADHLQRPVAAHNDPARAARLASMTTEEIEAEAELAALAKLNAVADDADDPFLPSAEWVKP